MNQALQAARRLQRLDNADQGPHRHADHGHPHAGRPQDLRRRSRRRSRTSARRSKRCCQRSAGLAASSRSAPAAATSWISSGTARSWPLRPEHGRRADGRAERHRRRERHHHRGRPRALPGQCPLHARFPHRTSTRSAACWSRLGRPDGRSRWRNWPRSSSPPGPAMIRDEDGLLTGYVYVDVAGRDPGSYVRGGRAAGARAGEAAAGLCHRRGAASTKRWSGCSERLTFVVPLTLFLIFLLLYLNTRSLIEDADRLAGGAVLGDRRDLVPVPARLQHEHRRLGRPDRAAGRGRRDGRLHAALSGPCLRAGEEGRPAAGRWRNCRKRSCTARSSGFGRSS